MNWEVAGVTSFLSLITIRRRFWGAGFVLSKLNTYLGVVQLFFTQSDPGFFLQFFLFFFGFCWGECAVHRLREADCSRSLTVFLRVSPPENGDNPSFLTSTESGRSLAENPGLRWTAWEAWPGFGHNQPSEASFRGWSPHTEPVQQL